MVNEEKIKIIFCLPIMLARGVEKSLLSLLNFFSEDKYDITVALVEKKGDFLHCLPSYVHIKEIEIPNDRKHEIVAGLTRNTVIRYFKDKKFLSGMRAVLNLAVDKVKTNGHDTSLFQVKTCKESFDVAVCYHIHCPFLVYYTREKVKARKYYAWMHNDFDACNFDVKKLRKELNKFNQIYGVSEKVVREFNNRVPELQDKVSLFHNVIDKDEILSKAVEYYPPEYIYIYISSWKILSVGGLEYQKGFDMAIEIAKKLVVDGYDFKWFIVGDGSEKEKLSDLICNYHLENIVYLLGVKENPYPYMKYCDIYVQPSRHEGYCLTSSEAKILKKPILTTNYAGVEEKFKDHFNASVVNFDSNAIENGIIELMTNKELRYMYIKNIENEPETENQQLNEFIDSIEK